MKRYKHYKVDQKWWIKVPFESPYPLDFDYTLSSINWFKPQIDSNDVKIKLFLISKIGPPF